MRDILGVDNMKEFQLTEPSDALELEVSFEIKKRNHIAMQSDKVIIDMPFTLVEILKTVDFSKYGGKVFVPKPGKLQFAASIIQECIDGPLDQLITHVTSLLSERKMKDVKSIMLVGGQAESLYVQEKFEKVFSDKRVIHPVECGLAVVKGAVLYGHQPDVIASRVARFTYGIEIAAKFDSKQNHPENKKTETNSGPVCTNLFWKIVTMHDDVLRDHEVGREGRAVNNKQTKIRRRLFRSENEDPKFTTDEGCTYIGDFEIPLDGRLPCQENVVVEKYCFGETEIVCKGQHRKTNQTFTLTLTLNE